jgi:hypothetical protein
MKPTWPSVRRATAGSESHLVNRSPKHELEPSSRVSSLDHFIIELKKHWGDSLAGEKCFAGNQQVKKSFS